MKHTKRITTLLLALVMCLSLTLPALAADYEYEISGGSLKFDPITGTITGTRGSLYDVNIPSEIYGVPVTKIGDSALSRSSIKKVTLPSTVTEIGRWAFDKAGFEEFEIPDSVAKIGERAFNRTKLKSITVPGSIKSVAKWCFAFCENLTSAALGEGVQKLEEDAFEGCKALESVSLPNSLEEIGNKAFLSCKALSSITFGTGLKRIGTNAFWGCDNLNEMRFQGNAPVVADGFKNLKNVIVYYPEGASGWSSPTWNGLVARSYRPEGSKPAPEPEPVPAPQPTPTPTPTPTPAPTPSKPAFTDVAANSPFKDAIAWAVEQSIAKGTSSTTFSTGSPCTHNHILTFLWRANGSPEAAGSSDFEKAASWAQSMGLIDSSFNGSAVCTRSETMVYLWKLVDSPMATSGASFTDVSAGASYAQAVTWAVQQGITSGTSKTTFSPATTCTRGQIVTFLYRAYA